MTLLVKRQGKLNVALFFVLCLHHFKSFGKTKKLSYNITNMRNEYKQKDNILVRWWKLCNPHKGALIGQIIFYSGYTLMLSVLTIFAARTINCMYNGEWAKAYMYLGLEAATILIRNISMHLQYKMYVIQCEHIRLVASKKVYNKILTAGDDEANALSKEKIINIATNNLANMADFPDHISNFVAYTIQVIFTLVIVFTSNWLAGLLVMVIGILNFFVYIAFNKKLGRLLMQRYEKKDDMFKSYSKVIDGKEVINELNGAQTYEEEPVTSVKGFTKSYSDYWMVTSWKNNIWWATWNVIVYGITFLMLYYVSQGTMDIAVYLVIVPYLSSCSDKLCTLFDKSSNLENMRVDVDRINTILNLSDEELIEYGDLNTKSDGYNLNLISVTEGAKPGQKYTLNNVTMQFVTGGKNVVRGPKECGKRVIFDLLRRYEYPDQGKILLDNLNLYDYNEKTFKTHINYCASYPMFIKGTIKENLLLANKDFNAITSLCDKLNLTPVIEKFPKGFDTDVTEIESSIILFALGLIRALLSNCKILMIYELPQDASEEFRKYLKQFVTSYKIDKTLIFFTHSKEFDDVADALWEVKEGKVKQVK